MIYALKRVHRSGVYRLNEAVNYFIAKGVDRPAFCENCFPDWFRPILQDSPTLYSHANALYAAVTGANHSQRNLLRAAWKSIWDVRSLTQDVTRPIVNVDSMSREAASAIEALFGHLYDGTLRSAVFERVTQDTHRKHFEEFRSLGQAVCPFCGLAQYLEPGGDLRENYDHFLARSKYPLGGVNFHNLAPMCTECNRSPRKGTKDVLLGPGTSPFRCRFPYPYGPIAPVEVFIDQVYPPNIRNRGGDWKVRIAARTPGQQDLVDNWEKVFNICERYQLRAKHRGQVWIDRFLRQEVRSKTVSPNEARAAFSDHAHCLLRPSSLRLEPEAIIEAAYFTWHAENADDAFFRSSIRSVTQRPLAPTLQRKFRTND